MQLCVGIAPGTGQADSLRGRWRSQQHKSSACRHPQIRTRCAHATANDNLSVAHQRETQAAYNCVRSYQELDAYSLNSGVHAPPPKRKYKLAVQSRRRPIFLDDNTPLVQATALISNALLQQQKQEAQARRNQRGSDKTKITVPPTVVIAGTTIAAMQAVKALAVATEYLSTEYGKGVVFQLTISASRGDAARQNLTAWVHVVADPCVWHEGCIPDSQVVKVGRNSLLNRVANTVLAKVLADGVAVLKCCGVQATWTCLQALVNARLRPVLVRSGKDLVFSAALLPERTPDKRQISVLNLRVAQCVYNDPTGATER